MVFAICTGALFRVRGKDHDQMLTIKWSRISCHFHEHFAAWRVGKDPLAPSASFVYNGDTGPMREQICSFLIFFYQDEVKITLKMSSLMIFWTIDHEFCFSVSMPSGSQGPVVSTAKPHLCTTIPWILYTCPLKWWGHEIGIKWKWYR